MFFVGLITGVVVVLTLYAIKNRVFTNKLQSVDGKKCRGDALQETKSKAYKMALLVRQDLKMGKGKVAAQCSHATVHCYEEGLRLYPEKISSWESNNKSVDLFKVANEMILLKYHELAVESGFNTYIVVDAGRTQVAPYSKTVLAIGPEMNEQINLLTRNLEVYN